MINSQLPSGLLNEHAAARMMGLAPATLRNLRSAGRGPSYIRLSGRAIRYRAADLEAYIARNAVGTLDQAAA